MTKELRVKGRVRASMKQHYISICLTEQQNINTNSVRKGQRWKSFSVERWEVGLHNNNHLIDKHQSWPQDTALTPRDPRPCQQTFYPQQFILTIHSVGHPHTAVPSWERDDNAILWRQYGWISSSVQRERFRQKKVSGNDNRREWSLNLLRFSQAKSQKLCRAVMCTKPSCINNLVVAGSRDHRSNNRYGSCWLCFQIRGICPNQVETWSLSVFCRRAALVRNPSQMPGDFPSWSLYMKPC